MQQFVFNSMLADSWLQEHELITEFIARHVGLHRFSFGSVLHLVLLALVPTDATLVRLVAATAALSLGVLWALDVRDTLNTNVGVADLFLNTHNDDHHDPPSSRGQVRAVRRPAARARRPSEPSLAHSSLAPFFGTPESPRADATCARG